MATQSSGANGIPDLKKEYNNHSIGKTITHMAKHVIVMGAMMGVIGLASPAFATAIFPDPFFAESASVTVGDLIVQTVHGAGEMLNMIVDTFSGLMSLGEPLITNVLDGNFAPSTWDSLVMSHGTEHFAMDPEHLAMTHTAAHIATDTPNWAFDEWLRNAYSSGDLPYALEDSETLGMTLEEHMMNEYGHTRH